MSHLAVIPARSGSKGLKDKNIKELNGKPLLAYSIEAALNSGVFECVHVSTDSDHYADISRQYGADVPFLRSVAKSTDTAGSWEAVKEVLDRYDAEERHFDIVTLLQPTSPLRTSRDISNAYSLYCEKKAKAVVSVCEMEHTPLWSNTLPEDGSMESFTRDECNLPRQLMPVYYRINGAIYMVNCSFLKENTNIYRKGCFAYVMDSDLSVDIDTQQDFEMAEFIIRKRLTYVFK